MELKKNYSADISRYRFLFLNIGLIISLLLTISAFEYRFYDRGPVIPENDLKNMDPLIDDIKPTVRKPPKPVYIQPQVIEIKTEEIKPDEYEIIFDPSLIDPGEIEELMTGIPEDKPDEIVDIAEVMPTPVGGYKAFYKYIGENLKYPAAARRTGIEGRVYVSFVIDPEGSISQVEVIKGIGGGCDEEAVRVIREAPRWNPGRQGRRNVSVRMRLPVTFRLKR